MMPPSVHEIEAVVRMQERFNRHVDARWHQKHYPFTRAVLVEVAEALDHYGWKWWSKQPSYHEQVALELIDVLGLLVSDVLQQCGGRCDVAVTQIVSRCMSDGDLCELDGTVHNLGEYGVPDLLDLLAALSICRRNAFVVLSRLFDRMGLTWDNVVTIFCAKTALNIFRQDHGYRSGTYRKYWGDKEDNEHLSDVLAYIKPLGMRTDALFDHVYDALILRYAEMQST